MLSTVYLAAEDELGLAVGRKLVQEAPPLAVYREDNARGSGKLKNKSASFQKMGLLGFPVLMVTDLDLRTCASWMIENWLGEPPCSGFLFRICVREVEAWLLAHRSAMAEFLSIPLARLPTAPDSLRDPKSELIALARHSPTRKIRLGFERRGTATIGPDYNHLLEDFVRNSWDAASASKASPSLARARKRLFDLASLAHLSSEIH